MADEIKIKDGAQPSSDTSNVCEMPISEGPVFPTEEVSMSVPEQTIQGTKFDLKQVWQSNAMWRDLSATIPEKLKGWLISQMDWLIDVVDRITNIDSLEQEDIDWLITLPEQLDKFSYNLQSPFLDNGSLSLLGLERIQNMFWRSSHISMARVNINMTLANKIDPTGNLGTAFKRATLRFLQKEFGLRSVSKNPEETSFTILYAQQHQLTDSFNRASKEIKYILKYEYNISLEMLNAFNPDFTVMLLTESNVPFAGYALPDSDRNTLSFIDHIALERITASLRLLAAGSTLAEKDPDKVGLVSGLMVYNTNDLPIDPSQKGYSVLQEAILNGLGYVPASRYMSDIDEPTYYDIKPRPGHEFGRFDHKERANDPGGYLQQFTASVNYTVEQFLTNAKPDLDGLKTSAQRLEYALELGWTAQLNPRNLDFVKWSQEIVLQDGRTIIEYPFVQQLSSISSDGSVNIATVEVDSFKAFGLAGNASSMPIESDVIDMRKEMDGDF